MNTRIRNGMAVVITAVWALSFVADIFVKEYDPSPFLHMIMMGLATAVFGANFLTGANGKPKDDSSPPPPPPPDAKEVARLLMDESIKQQKLIDAEKRKEGRG